MWKFQTNRTKNEEVIAYTSWVVVWREVYINQPYRLASHIAYKGGRGGVMVKCIAFSHGSCLLMLYLPSGAKQTGIHGHQTSITQETSWRAVAQYVLLSADLSLPSLSDISKVDCAGGKFKTPPWIFNGKRRIMAHFKEEEPCITVTLSFFL